MKKYLACKESNKKLLINCRQIACFMIAWVKVFRTIPEFRILKVGLKMLNSAGNNSFSDLVLIHLKVFDHLSWNFLYFGGVQQVLNSDFLKFRIWEILNFHPCD